MLQNFKYELDNGEMDKELKFDATLFLVRPLNKINLRVIKR